MSESRWTRRTAGLLVPADVEPLTAEPIDDDLVDQVDDGDALADDPVAELEARLAVDRRSTAVRAGHDVAVRRGRLLRRQELAELADAEAEHAAELRRRQADRDARIELESLRRVTASGGHRARIRAMVMMSAEHRAVRVESVRRWSIRVGAVALAVMAVWSTAGVHAGVVHLIGLSSGSLGWWAAWIVEPALMAVVALVIVSRSMLRSSGGVLSGAADVVEYGALGTSILLNLASGGSVDGWSWAAAGVLAAHSIGPVGAAGVAYLIGVIDASCASADPWAGAPTLAELGLIEPVSVTFRAHQSTSTNADHMASEQGQQERYEYTPINQGKQLQVAGHMASEQGQQGVTPINQGKQLSVADQTVLDRALAAINRGELTTPVTAAAIYRDVMGKRGDKGRATRVAALLTI